MGWSPEQIAGRLTLEKASRRITHETIYRFVYEQIRRTNDYRWRHYLPRAESRRGWRPRRHRPMDHIKNRVSLKERRACGEPIAMTDPPGDSGYRPASTHRRRRPRWSFITGSAYRATTSWR